MKLHCFSSRIDHSTLTQAKLCLPFFILGEPSKVPPVGQVQEVFSLGTRTSTQLLLSSVVPQALQLLSKKFSFKERERGTE